MRWIYLTVALLLLGAAGWLAGNPRFARSTGGTTAGAAPGDFVTWIAAIALLIGAVFALDATFPLFDLAARRTWAGLAFAAAALAVLFIMLERKLSPRWFLPLLLVFAIPQWANSYILLFHGLMHTSFVYECFLHGLPPENPLMSGEPLRYMYGLHAIIAAVMQVLPLSPTDGFAVANGVSLLAFAVIVDRIAVRISSDPAYRVLTVVLALFGMDLFVDGPLQQIAAAGLGSPRRYGPVIALMKFTGVNSNGVGMVCFAMGILALVRLVTRTGGQNQSYLILAAGSLLAIFVYQPAWMAIGAFALSGSALVILFRYQGLQRQAWIVMGVFAITTTMGLPVLYSMVDDSSSGAAVKLFPTFFQLRLNGKFLIMHMLVPAVLLVLTRHYMIARVREKLPVFSLLALTIVVLDGTYMILRLPSGNEYKFLLFATTALAPLVALALHRIYVTHKRAAIAATFAMMIPFMTDFTYITLPQPLAHQVESVGRRIHHADPAEDELYSWIWGKTDKSAVFVDSIRSVPALAGRHLFVAMDIGRDPRLDQGALQDGWLISSHWFLTEIIHVDAKRRDQRQQLVTALLTDSAPIDPALLSELRAATPSARPVYVIARDDRQKQRMSASASLQVVYEGSGRSVFKLAL